MKNHLRQVCLYKRDSLTEDEHGTRSFAVCRELTAYLSTLSLQGKCVALYNPIKSELDITPVLHALDAEGIAVALPVVESGRPELSFFRFRSMMHMSEGAFGVLEPEQFEQLTPDIIIVPLVGFDRSLHRIGYGKGYYDATLSGLRAINPALLAIGVAFAVQEMEQLPAEPHDAKLDAIITEKEILTTNPRSLKTTV